MVDLELIEKTIDDLVNNAPTNFETCEKLAHLTITRDLLIERRRCGVDAPKGNMM